MGLPLVSLVTLIIANRKLKRGGVTIWDADGGYEVCAAQSVSAGPWRPLPSSWCS